MSKYNKWIDWLAWYPVKIQGRWRWLIKVERYTTIDTGGDMGVSGLVSTNHEYRLHS